MQVQQNLKYILLKTLKSIENCGISLGLNFKAVK